MPRNKEPLKITERLWIITSGLGVIAMLAGCSDFVEPSQSVTPNQSPTTVEATPIFTEGLSYDAPRVTVVHTEGEPYPHLELGSEGAIWMENFVQRGGEKRIDTIEYHGALWFLITSENAPGTFILSSAGIKNFETNGTMESRSFPGLIMFPNADLTLGYVLDLGTGEITATPLDPHDFSKDA